MILVTGIRVEVRVPYQGGEHSLAYGRETKLCKHRPLHQYGRGIVFLIEHFSTDTTGAEIRKWRRGTAVALEKHVEHNNQVIQYHNDGLDDLAQKAIRERGAQLDAVRSLSDAHRYDWNLVVVKLLPINYAFEAARSGSVFCIELCH